MRREPTTPATAPDVPLRSLAELAAEMGLVDVAAEAGAFADRLAAGRVYVACVGQFKRGKSTLLNALVGVDVLPTGVAPVTSAIVVVRHAAQPHAAVRYLDGTTETVAVGEIAAYVTEDRNPGNAKRVAAVEVGVPSPLLASGLCLVDTPGVASVFTSGTAVTRAFVPQIDAAIVLLGTDPPVSADEVGLVEAIAQETGELIFVVGKADRTSEAERAEARRFAERILSDRLGRRIGPMLEVSATERRQGRPGRDWDALVARLAAVAVHRRDDVLGTAGLRGVRALSARLRREVDEREGALRRPVDASERRIASLRRCAAEAEHALHDLAPLLAAERARLHARFVAQQEAFLARALPAARRQLGDALARMPERGRTRRWRAACALVQATFRPLLAAWQREMDPVASRLFAEATARFTEHGDALLARLKAEAGVDVSGVSGAAVARSAPRADRVFFTELLYATGRSAGQWLLDHLRLPAWFEAALRRRAAAYLDRLVTTNASRITADLDERVLDSRRRLEHELRGQLRSTHEVAERALAEVRRRHEEGSGAVRSELARLAGYRRALDALRDDAPVAVTEGQ